MNSVGIIPRRLPFSASNTLVRTFRHAIALDERRAKFKVNHWSRATQEEALRSITDQRAARREKREEARKAKQEKEKRDHKGHLHHYEARYSKIRHETDVEEVWFAGCHCGTCILGVISPEEGKTDNCIPFLQTLVADRVSH